MRRGVCPWRGVWNGWGLWEGLLPSEELKKFCGCRADGGSILRMLAILKSHWEQIRQLTDGGGNVLEGVGGWICIYSMCSVWAYLTGRTWSRPGRRPPGTQVSQVYTVLTPYDSEKRKERKPLSPLPKFRVITYLPRVMMATHSTGIHLKQSYHTSYGVCMWSGEAQSWLLLPKHEYYYGARLCSLPGLFWSLSRSWWTLPQSQHRRFP